MKKEFSIIVNDSVFSTKRWGMHAAILFAGCFMVQFIIYCLFDNMWKIHNKYIEEYMPEIALVITVFRGAKDKGDVKNIEGLENAI